MHTRFRNPTIIVAAALAMLATTPVLAGPNHGLAAHYALDGDALDASGNGQHGTPVGSPAFGAGFRAAAVTLDGVDDVIQLPRSIENDFTVAFWVRTTAVAPAGINWFEGLGLIDGEVCFSPPGGDWGIAMMNGGHVVWGSALNTSSTTEVNDGSWHAVVLTRSLISGHVELWIDGELEATDPASPTTPLTGPPWIGIGNNPCDASFARLFLAGAVDEVRFYDRVLTSSEVSALSRDWLFFDGFESGDLTSWSGVAP